MWRTVTAILIAGVLAACQQVADTVGPTRLVCDLDASYDDGYAAGLIAAGCEPTHRYENDGRDVIVDGRRFHREDSCTLNSELAGPVDAPLDVAAAREWACQELRYAYATPPGSSFTAMVARVWGTTQDDTGAFTISFDTDTDARLSGAEADTGEWQRRWREAARDALRCVG